jgi:hypothetical protein
MYLSFDRGMQTKTNRCQGLDMGRRKHPGAPGAELNIGGFNLGADSADLLHLLILANNSPMQALAGSNKHNRGHCQDKHDGPAQ